MSFGAHSWEHSKASLCLKNHVEKGWQTVSGKDQVVNTAGFAGHAVSVPTIQLRRLSAEAAVRW